MLAKHILVRYRALKMKQSARFFLLVITVKPGASWRECSIKKKEKIGQWNESLTKTTVRFVLTVLTVKEHF